MTRNSVNEKPLHEGLITALSLGGIFIILGLIFAITPGISQQTNNFFSDLTTVSFPFGNPGSTVSLLAPSHPDNHQGFYSAVMNFLIGVGVLQIFILGLRFALHSGVTRLSQSIGDLIFWIGAAVMASVFLMSGTQSGWFQFWSSLIVLIGVSLIARFFVYLVKKHK